MMWKTALEIATGVREGSLTATEVVQSSLKTIAEKNPELNAFLEVFEEEALADAARIDAKKANGEELGRLAGVPVAIKDNMAYTGKTPSCGSEILKGYTASYDSTLVKRLKEADAIIVGRTNMDEFAMGSSNETSAYGNVKNPWDASKVPGGSSGGSAAAVASGMVPLSFGSDTGGSIRQPASLCGIVGMKPSYGRVSRYGLVALASSLDQIGPFAHTVEDAALALEVIEGRDEHDATSVTVTEKAVAELLPERLDGMVIGMPKEYFIDEMDDEIRKRVEEGIDVLKELGATIKEVSIDLTPYALPAYYIIQPAEASSNLARFDGMRYGDRPESGGLWERYITTRSKGFGREVKRRILLGTYILSAGYYDAYYKKAQAVKTALADEINEVLKEVDILVMPTSPAVAWDLGERFDDPIAMYLADIFTVTANITGIPGISVPCGFAHELPVGLQFMGGHMQDHKILDAAAAYQKATKWHLEHPAQ